MVLPDDWSTPRFSFGQSVTWNTIVSVRARILGMSYAEGYWQYEIEYNPQDFDSIDVPSEYEEGIACVTESELNG